MSVSNYFKLLSFYDILCKTNTGEIKTIRQIVFAMFGKHRSDHINQQNDEVYWAHPAGWVESSTKSKVQF